jgi:predicted acetyltransferase
MDIMCGLVLAEASKEHEKRAMAYRQEYIDRGETHINGSSGFIHYDDYDEWLGYGICPSERRKGYGTRQLALVLLEAKKLHIPRVMITCDRNNRGSAKVIINNGGVLLGEGFDDESKTITEIYWINIM